MSLRPPEIVLSERERAELECLVRTHTAGQQLVMRAWIILAAGELWLSILVRKLLRRGNFTSTDDLRNKVLAFIEYFNRTMAKPFKWTYQGKPLHV